MNFTLRSILLALALVCSAAAARADLLIYSVGPMSMALQGKVQVNPGNTVTFFHPKFGQLYFSLESVKHYPAPTTQQQFNRMVGKAENAKDTGAMFQAGVWALKHGLLSEYFETINKILEIDPKHEESLRTLALKKQMDEPIADSSQQERELRELVRKGGMKVALSKHFILLHDTPEKAAEGHKKPRADERIDLLESVYESFLLMFFSKGVPLEIPKERMKVVLFNDYNDYRDFALARSPSLASASGFWEHDSNTSFFYDHGTDEQFKEMQKVSDEFEKQANEIIRLRAKGMGEFIRFARTLKLMVQVAQENQDITVVSHECTHQMAGNTGLFPRHVMVPSWVHEGLATYFEAPGDATWSGIGAVNEDRLEWYRALERDREHSNIDFIVSDQIFDLAASHGSKVHAYGQAWAMTHFMLENDFERFITYYRTLGEMPPDMMFGPDVLQQVFTRVYGPDRTGLDQKWRSYMRGLKTDLQVIIESK